jgi:two-component sensor histidine kinase
MQKLLSFFCCLLFFITINAQNEYVLKDTSFFYFNNFYQLADKGYTFEQIRTDSTLPFKRDSLFNVNGQDFFWIKATIQNNSNYDKSFAMAVAPLFNNTMYHFNEDTQQWQTKLGGYQHSYFFSDNRKFIPYSFKSKSSTTLYFKVGVGALKESKHAINTFIVFKPQQLMEQTLNKQISIWAITICVVLAFFLYNAYLYFMFKDKSYLYYLLITISGILYITCDNAFLSFFTGLKYLSASMPSPRNFFVADLDYIVRQYAIITLFIGFFQFARTYLQTKILMPLWDKILKQANIISTIIMLGINIPISSFGVKFVPVFTVIQNVLYGIILILLLVVGFVGIKKRNPQAKYYLAAQGLCIITMLLLVAYLFANDYDTAGMPYLGSMAILIQTIFFAVALVARVNLLKEDLFQKKLLSEQAINNLAIQQEQNKRLEDKIEYNKKELAAAEQIKLLLKEIHHRVKNNLQIISSLLYMQFKDNKDEKMLAQLKQAQERIKSMALVHNKLYETNDVVHVYLKEYIADLASGILSSNTPSGKNINLHIAEDKAVSLSLDTSISIGLMLNELITNSCKYAFTNKEQGNISINITQQNSQYTLQVIDDGSGLPQDFEQRNSLGVRLIKNLARQLGGDVSFTNNNGTTVLINFKDAVAA